MRKTVENKALVVIDLQNDITKNYREIIKTANQAIDWAAASGMQVIYIKHNNLSAGTRTFKPDTHGAEFVPELRIVSDCIFVKTKSNALTSEDFSDFIREHNITEFYLAGADAHRTAGNDYRCAHTAFAEAGKGALRNGPGGSLSAQPSSQILRGEQPPCISRGKYPGL